MEVEKNKFKEFAENSNEEKKDVPVGGRTKFYSEGFEKSIGEVPQIVSLNIGDTIVDDEGVMYGIVWKMFNPKLNLLLYQARKSQN